MIMEKNWKLCERLVIGIFEDSEALIADPSQKTGEKEIDKKLGKISGKKLFVENNNFSIRICGMNIMINHPDFSNELILSNQTELQEIIKIISQIQTDKGVFEGNNWSLLMDNHKNFLPAKEGIDIYDIAEVEMIRRFSLINSPKTSKWDVGYSYCDETKTYYYLGTVCSWINKESSITTKYGPQSDVELHMVLDSDSFKPVTGQQYTVSELIKKYFTSIQFLKKKSTMSKIKTAFATDDFTNYVPFLDSMIDNWIKENKTTCNSKSNLIFYKEDLSRLFRYFEYSKTNETIILSMDSISKLEKILRNCIKYCLVKHWQKEYTSASASAIISEIRGIFYDSFFKETNIYNRQSYYEDMIEKVSGLRVDDLINKEVSLFDPMTLMDTWENYVNNIINVDFNSGDLTDFLLDESYEKNQWHYGYHQKTKTTFTDPEKKVFDDIMDFCRETSKSSSEYFIKNSGSLSKPKYVEQFTITIDTIFRMYGDNVPEDVQQVLMNGKFKRVIIKKDYNK